MWRVGRRGRLRVNGSVCDGDEREVKAITERGSRRGKEEHGQGDEEKCRVGGAKGERNVESEEEGICSGGIGEGRT